MRVDGASFALQRRYLLSAQKRVSRSLVKLREELARHGVEAAAGSLIVLSANAVQAAPAGLMATIAAAATVAGATAATTGTATTTVAKIIAMTTIQKGLMATGLVLAVSKAVYQAHQASILRLENQRLQQAQAPLAEQIQQLQREHDDSTNRLAGLLIEMERLRGQSAENSKLRGDLRRASYELAQLRAGKNGQASPSAALADAWSQRADSIIVEKAPVDAQVDALLQIKTGTFTYKSIGIINMMDGEPRCWDNQDLQFLTALLKQVSDSR